MEEPTPVESEPPAAAPVTEDTDVNKEKEVKKTQRRSKEEKSSRKKDEKSVEQVLKALSSLGTPEEKLAAMCKKYTEIFDESKKHQLSAKTAEKKLVSLQREKEQLQGEQSKSVLTRSRLENLCRELQRQNKAMKEESLLRIREEEEKRKDVSAKFHATLADITSLMQQNTESNSKLRDENLEMQSKFKSICEQYELREQQVDKISKQMKLESQLAEAKLRKAKLEMLAEKEILERDKQAALAELNMCKSKIVDQEKTEEALRAQINVYFEKYDEFQNVLTKSNQVYAGFKGEMEKMSKKITRLEKETSSWKQKWEGSHKALLQLAAEKQMKDAEVQLQARQLAQLQKLCRSLQGERTSLLQQLKSLGIVPQIEEGSPDKESPIQEPKTEPPKPEKKPEVAATSKLTTDGEIKPGESESATIVVTDKPNENNVSLNENESSVAATTSVIVPVVNEQLPADDANKTETLPEVLNSISDVSEDNKTVSITDTTASTENNANLVSTNTKDPLTAVETAPTELISVEPTKQISEVPTKDVKDSPESSGSTETAVSATPILNGVSAPKEETKGSSPSSSASSDKKASPPGKGPAVSSGEQKKGKEGGRRRKK